MCKFEFITLRVEKKLHDQYLLERYPKLDGQSRITNAVVAIFIFVRFMEEILLLTNFFVEKHYNSHINLLSNREWEVFGLKKLF